MLDIADAGKDLPNSNLDIVPLSFYINYNIDSIMYLFISEAFLNQTGLTIIEEGRRIPTPDSTFPYPRLASTYGDNTTNTYLYHQLDDSVLVEDTWDGDPKSFWISKNITIDTQMVNPGGT